MLAVCIVRPALGIRFLVDVDPKEANPMERRYPEVVGVRRTGWAALDRDPQEDGRVCLSPLRHSGTEECPPRADAISFYGRFFAGPAGRSHQLPLLQPIPARSAYSNVARSGRNSAL